MISGVYTEAFQIRHCRPYAFRSGLGSDSQHHFPNLQEGIVLPEEMEKILEIANWMMDETNADGLILGCTELPLIIQEAMWCVRSRHHTDSYRCGLGLYSGVSVALSDLKGSPKSNMIKLKLLGPSWSRAV